MGTVTEVLDGLTGVLGSTEEEGVGTSGGLEGELVEGEGLATGSDDAGTGSGGEAEGRNVDVGDLEEAVVVGDGANNDDSALLTLLDVRGDARERDGRAVDAGHKQSAEDNLVEVGVGTADKEPVKLNEKLQVDVVALGSSAVGAAHMVPVEIDS